MKILIVGSGGRECAVAQTLKRQRPDINLVCVGKHINSLISHISLSYPKINICDTEAVCRIARNEQVQIAFIGPEAPLKAGLADNLWKMGIAVVGPTQFNAQIETSKAFTRQLLDEYGLSQYNPRFDVLDVGNLPMNDYPRLEKHILSLLRVKYQHNYVIKADGLRGGKGVRISDHDLNNEIEALEYIYQLLNEDGKCVIEEKLVGEEFSLMSFVNRRGELEHMPLVQDYKKAFDNDAGPNTGGMGCVSLPGGMLPFVDEKDILLARGTNEAVIDALNKKRIKYNEKREMNHDDGRKEDENNIPYIGILYGGFMKTESGEIRVIEYNARFGDPECLNIMRLLQTNLFDIFCSMVSSDENAEFPRIEYDLNQYVVTRYICPRGYPNKPLRDIILNIDEMNLEYLVSASLGLNNRMLGSRALAVVIMGTDLRKVLDTMEKQLDLARGQIFYRRDIGYRYLVEEEITESNDDNKQKRPRKSMDLLDEDDNLVFDESLSKRQRLVKKPLTYKQSGVDIDEGNLMVEKIKPMVVSTFNSHVVNNFGNFGSLFALNNSQDDEYFLTSSMDGVGTKVQLVTKLYPREEAFYMLGHDLFGSNINDILCIGYDVQPLWFTDYFGCRYLKHEEAVAFVRGLSDACRSCGCVLIGGETAELKDFNVKNSNYLRHESTKDSPNWYELVGSIVGRVRRSSIFDAKSVVSGDMVIGIRSSGFHTNGYSMINRLYIDDKLNTDIWKHALCAPHRNYYSHIQQLRENNIPIKGLCHITGGGLVDNPPRILPEGMEIEWNDWELPPIFKIVQKAGEINDEEMRRTFNCGIGMLLVVRQSEGIYDRIGKILGYDEIVMCGHTTFSSENTLKSSGENI